MHTPSRLLLLAFAILTLCVLPRPAIAQPRTGTADAAEVEFQLGNKSYLAGRYEQALAHYFESYRLSPNLNVLFNLAGCYEALGSWVESYRYYQEHAQGVTPDNPVRTQSLAALERIGARVAILDVVANAPDATIFLDRRDLGAYGIAPRRVPVKAGAFNVMLEAPGYEPWESGAVTAKLGAVTRVEAQLVRLTGGLEVVGSPVGATVVARTGDRAVTGTLPSRLVLGSGPVEIEVSHPGHFTGRWTVSVPPGGEARLDAMLVQQTGSIIVSADEVGALVRLDGKPAGFTPTVLDRVLVGEHELAVEVSGYKTFRTRVVLGPDERVEVKAILAVSDEVEAASRTRESVSSAPASVTLVPGLELEAMGATNVIDALRGVRGVYTSDDGHYSSSGFRGFSPFGDYSNRVLLQLDGHTLNEGWYGSSLLGFEGLVGVDHLERVEVVRGPGSTLHGSGAIFGVINLVSRDGFSAPSSRVRLGAVGPRVGRLTLEATSPIEGGSVLAWGGLLYEQPSEFLSPARVGSDEAPDGRAGNMGETLAGSSHLRVRLGDFTFAGFFNRHKQQFPTGHFGTAFGDRRSAVTDTRAFLEARYDTDLTPTLALSSRIEWDLAHYDGDYAYSDGVLTEEFRGQSVGAEGRLSWQSSPTLRFIAGLAYRFEFKNDAQGAPQGDPASSYLDESHPFHKVSLFAGADLNPWPWLAVTAGLRFEGLFLSELADAEGNVADESILTLNPRVAFLLKPADDHTIKVMLGRAFRAPSIGELTYNDGGFTQVPSPDLTPEVAYTAELEWVHSLSRGFDVVAGAFLTQIEDLIQISGEGDETDPFRYSNQGAPVWATGVELELRRQFQRGLMMAFAWSAQHSRIGSLFDGERLVNSPAHIFSGRAVFPIVGRDLSFTTRLGVETGRRDRDGEDTQLAVLLDVGLWGQRLDSGLEYGFWIRNVLDWDIGHPVGAEVEDTTIRQPGRHVTATVGYRF